MRRGPFIAKRDGDYYTLEFSYAPELIDFIKGAAPRRMRWWDPGAHCWTVHKKYLDRILSQARFMGFSVRVEHASDDGDDDFDDDPPRTAPSTGDPITNFAHLLSYDALAAAYKTFATEIHPDKPAGNPETMKRLNGLFDEIKKKFGK